MGSWYFFTSGTVLIDGHLDHTRVRHVFRSYFLFSSSCFYAGWLPAFGFMHLLLFCKIYYCASSVSVSQKTAAQTFILTKKKKFIKVFVFINEFFTSC